MEIECFQSGISIERNCFFAFIFACTGLGFLWGRQASPEVYFAVLYRNWKGKTLSLGIKEVFS